MEADAHNELPGEVGREEMVKDAAGKEWHCVTPASFHFEFVKDEKAARAGLVLKSGRMFADSGPVRSKMSKS